MHVFPAHMSVYHIHAWCLLMSERGIRFSELELGLRTTMWVLEVKSGSSVRTSALNSCLQPYNLGLVNVTFHCLSLTWPVTWLTSCSYGRNQIHLWHDISSSVSRGSVICDSPEWKRCPPDYLPRQATVVGSPFHLAQTCQLLGYIWHQLLVEADFW